MDANCLHCGAVFLTSAFRQSRGQGRYCSIACTRAAKRGLRQELTCQHCSATFVLLVSRIRAGQGKYCSIACASAASIKPKLPGARRKRTSYAAYITEEPPGNPAQRRCLGGCGQMFASTWSGHRVCDNCARSESRAGHAITHEARGLHVR